MNNITTPAKRQTSSSVWSAFLLSGKRHLIITGSKKSGKTTLLSHLPTGALCGITTFAKPGKGVYLTESLTGATTQIGAFDTSIQSLENRMTPLPDGFMSLGVSALANCIKSDSEYVSIDEIGYLETSVTQYTSAIVDLMDKKRLIAVVRKQNLPFLNYLCSREDVFLVDLDVPSKPTGCVIMASGLGKRFGSNKLMTPFCGKPLVEWIMDSTEGIFEKRVVVTRHEAVANLAKSKGLDVILHSLPYRSDTVRLGLEALGDINACVFCPGDQPLIQKETLTSLIDASCSNFILRTKYDFAVGMPVLFPKWTFDELQSLPQGMGGNYVIKKHPDKVGFVTAQSAYELKDIDTVEDLKELEEYLSK